MIVVCAIKQVLNMVKMGTNIFEIESVKTTSMENVSKGVLDKHKEHYVRCKDKVPEKSLWCIKTYKIAYTKIQKMKIYNPLCQTWGPTVV